MAIMMLLKKFLLGVTTIFTVLIINAAIFFTEKTLELLEPFKYIKAGDGLAIGLWVLKADWVRELFQMDSTSGLAGYLLGLADSWLIVVVYDC